MFPEGEVEGNIDIRANTKLIIQLPEGPAIKCFAVIELQISVML